MSKHNKVNKSNYDQGGRLTPDELARERQKQGELSSRTSPDDRAIGKVPELGGAPGGSPRRTGPGE